MVFLGSLTVVCLDAYLVDHFCLTGGQTDCEDNTCITIYNYLHNTHSHGRSQHDVFNVTCQ